jgi:hypothetical protein
LKKERGDWDTVPHVGYVELLLLSGRQRFERVEVFLRLNFQQIVDAVSVFD